MSKFLVKKVLFYSDDNTLFMSKNSCCYYSCCSVPEGYKVNPGPVEMIAPHPLESNKILIGYQRGLIVLWDRKQLNAEQVKFLFNWNKFLNVRIYSYNLFFLIILPL